jgi:tRNA1(Val) A37 N6-methylase TrmN6
MHLVYSQPDFYHFSEDSTFLANVAAKKAKETAQVLDLCAGCGVVGIEFWRQRSNIRQLTFLEKQIEFKAFLDVNIQHLKDIETSSFYECFTKMNFNKKFDLILCNPPYFAKEASRASSNKNKNICRSIEKNQMSVLLNFIDISLNEKGVAMLVLPHDNIYWIEALEKCSRNKRVIDKNESAYILELF